MPTASEETAIETLAGMVGRQRREGELTRTELRALTQRIGDHDSATRALTRRLGDFEGVTRTQLGGIGKQIERQQKSLSVLHIGSRIGSQPELSGRQRLLRHVVLRILKQPGDDALRTWIRLYGSRGQRQELEDGAQPVVKGSREDLLHRASQNPAMITVPSWAAELVVTDLADFLLQAPRPSLFAQLASRGVALEFGNSGVVFPIPAATPSGGWIGEGQPIPVAQGALGLAVLQPRKLAALSVFSDEVRDLSLPSIEAVIEHLLSENLKRILDTTLVDAAPASATRPAGLRNGVAALAASALTDPVAAMIADVRALVGAAVEAGGSSPVLIMPPEQAISMATIVGTGLPATIVSPSVPPDLVICVDGGSFVSALGPPRMSLSRESVVHEETVPLPISTGTMAAPTRSLWQSDASGLRMIFDCSWALAGTGKVAWMAGVLW